MAAMTGPDEDGHAGTSAPPSASGLHEPAPPGQMPHGHHTLEQDIQEALQEVPQAELEQVAQNTSRKLLILVLAGAALFALVRLTPLAASLQDLGAFSQTFKGGGLRAELYFVLISGFLVMVGVPRLLFYALGGMAFGLWQGLLWSQAGCLLGSFIAFRAARWGGKEWLTQRFGGNRFFARIVHARPTVASVVVMRMLPVSNGVINVGLALSKVRNRAFLAGSFIGFLPQGVVAVMIGSGIAQDVPWAGAAQIGMAASLLLGIWWWARRKKRQAGPDPHR